MSCRFQRRFSAGGQDRQDGLTGQRASLHSSAT